VCGRFTLRLPPQELQKFFDLVRAEEYVPRYNIAPTQDIVAIRQEADGRVASMMHWGLLPHWAKDRKMAARMINARGETVSEKPSFRVPFKRHRCLIPADGFYEWKATGGKYKQPYHITLNQEQPFAIAGLWSVWSDPQISDSEQARVTSCTIITTSANPLMEELHERMPVILPRESWEIWLDPDLAEDQQGEDVLKSLLTSYPAAHMQFRAVSRLVSNARNETPNCLQEPEGGEI
jgi:putative SOS response-associated peptidase YedK